MTSLMNDLFGFQLTTLSIKSTERVFRILGSTKQLQGKNMMSALTRTNSKTALLTCTKQYTVNMYQHCHKPQSRSEQRTSPVFKWLNIQLLNDPLIECLPTIQITDNLVSYSFHNSNGCQVSLLFRSPFNYLTSL